jgi:hypothetical protein
MATTQGNHRLAVLIDVDNAQPSVIDGLLAESPSSAWQPRLAAGSPYAP